MLNLLRNFNITKGHVRSVDVLREREQERRARLQLLDDIREPSPQPIFGEPVKVDLEDETSRRIKNTLGDFTQVLVNDPKNLIGISRSTPVNPLNGATGFAAGSSAHGAPRNQAVLKKPPYVPMAKPSIPNHISPKGPDKRPKFQQSPAKPSAGMQPCQVLIRDSVGKNQRNSIPVVELPKPSINNNSLPISAPIWNSAPAALTPIHLPTSATPSVLCKDVVKQVKPNDPTKNESATPAKRNNGRPSNLKIQPEKNSSTDAPIAVETILKQMTDVVAPLTGIQTPRKEETGFVFSAKQDTSSINEDKDVSVPPYTKLPLQKPPSPKPQKKQPDPPPVPVGVTVNVTKDSDKPVSLQDDLAVSDSDEEVVPELKINPEQCLKSPVNDIIPVVNIPLPTSNNNTMDDNSAESSNSSSSDDSDSDDSSSESNDSDSSSGVSDEEISSKKWGLSNFVDESQRIHSPAFFPVDTPKETIQLNAEKVKSVSLNGVNPSNDTSLVQDSSHQPTTEATPFLVPDVPVTSKSEILSPIPSPVHTQVGPRTPPSPSCSIKQDVPEKNKNDTEKSISQSENMSIDDNLTPNKSSPHSDDNRDISANKGNVQNEKCKKQLRSSKLKEQNSEAELSKGVSVEESSCLKEIPGLSLEKSKIVGVESLTSSNEASVTSEPGSENYPIKTRQRVSTRRKSTLDNSNESISKLEEENSAIAKLKHPRACRKFAEKQTKKSTSMKVKPSEEPKKHTKQENKDNSSITEKIKTPITTANTTNIPKTKSIKTLTKTKGKNSKTPPKKSSEVEKPDIKKKKFAIKNFVQTPENAGTKPSSVLSTFTPSPERSPVPEIQKNSEIVTEQASVSSVSSKPHGKSNTNTPVKVKKVEKLRRSVRCSERASNNAQADSSATQQTSDIKGKKRNLKVLGKEKRSTENVLITIEPPVELLSPIPHDPSSTSQGSDCVIPHKIMVCIPLNMLSRFPGSAKKQSQESTSRVASKNSSSSDDTKIQKKENTDKDLKKNSTLKSAQSKDKIKTAVSMKSEKNNSKKLKDKNKEVKPMNSHLAKTKPASNENKTIKVKDKTVVADIENKLPKKRKNDTKDKQNVKKPKLSLQQTEDRKPKELPPIVKTESTTNSTNDGNKSKPLERCDSTGSLSSLCSQQSQKSSKSSKDRMKDSSSGAPESKRIKTSGTPLLSVKDIKQEKSERAKVHSTIDKNVPNDKKNKSKDKLGLMDVVDQIVDESFSSSQYRLFEESCKEESKGKILGSNPNASEPENRNLVDWDNFAPEMHKEMKDASTITKHNPQAPVMPMDYYFTEGKKQKLLAEKEKDPFQQAVKYFEAAVLFILTSQQREEYSKDPVSVYQFYYETLKFSSFILSKVKKLQTCPGSTEFKLLILCLKCQSLLSVKLYNLKIKEIKEQLDGVAEFLQLQCPAANPLKLQSHQSRFPSFFSIPSPHSTIPSPASNSQNNSSDRSQTVNVPQNILDTICRQHTHLINLHRGHDLWEQADMYMTRSNLREFFKEVADQLEPLTLHSSITELVKYIQKGISLVKKSLR